MRAAKALGFNGFDDLRAPFRHALVATTAFDERPDWITFREKEGAVGPVQAESALNTLSIVQHSLQHIDPHEVDCAVERLLDARSVYIMGVRASYGLACYFHYVGRMILPSLQLMSGPMIHAIDVLDGADASDAMIAITVSPYSRETIEACRLAQVRGVQLIMLADSDLISPNLAPQHVFVASTVSTHHFACYAGLMGIAEGLLAVLVAMGGAPAQERVKDYDALRSTYSAHGL